MKKLNLNYSGKWMKPEEIKSHPEHHSSPIEQIPLLLILERYEYPQPGYYYAGLINEFYMVGSPSFQSPIYYTPTPSKP